MAQVFLSINYPRQFTDCRGFLLFYYDLTAPNYIDALGQTV